MKGMKRCLNGAWPALLMFAPDHLNILLEGKWNSSTMCWSLTNQSSPPETNIMTHTLLTSAFTYKLTRPANICLAAILSSMSPQFLAVSFLQGSWKHSENVVLVGATQFVQMAQLHIRDGNLWLRLMPKVPCRTVQSGTWGHYTPATSWINGMKVWTSYFKLCCNVVLEYFIQQSNDNYGRPGTSDESSSISGSDK